MTMYGKDINKAISCLMSENKNLGHNSKKDFLKNPVEHIDITSFDQERLFHQWKKCLLFQEKLQMQPIFLMK